MRNTPDRYAAAVKLGVISEEEAQQGRMLPLSNGGESSDWTSGLRCNSKGQPHGDEANVLYALRHAPALAGVVRFNEFFNRIELARKPHWRHAKPGERWSDEDDLDVMAWLQESGMPVRGRATVADSIARVARDNIFHPVRDFLDGLVWDDKPRLETWLQDYLGADADPVYLAAVGQAFLISAVARVLNPGCQADHVLVLEGRQGVGKTRTLQTLGDPWTTDSLPDLHSKDAAVQLQGVWLVELAELAALRRSEIEATKAFITRRIDRYRPPYGRHPVDVPRQCVFIATTNEATYLRDPTGNRRFWPVRISKADVDMLAEVRDQLWAEAVALFREDMPWHLTGQKAKAAQDEQDKRVHRTELEQLILEYLDRIEAASVREVTTREVFCNALGLSFPEDVDKAKRLGVAVNQAMNAAGWNRTRISGRAENRRVYYGRSPHSDSQ